MCHLLREGRGSHGRRTVLLPGLQRVLSSVRVRRARHGRMPAPVVSLSACSAGRGAAPGLRASAPGQRAPVMSALLRLLASFWRQPSGRCCCLAALAELTAEPADRHAHADCRCSAQSHLRARPVSRQAAEGLQEPGTASERHKIGHRGAVWQALLHDKQQLTCGEGLALAATH